VAVEGERIVRASLGAAVAALKTVDPELLHDVAEVFFD